jgi:cysteine-rich repeat protein
MEVLIGGVGDLQASQPPGTSNMIIRSNQFTNIAGGATTNLYGTGTLNYYDCQGEWCIFEMCISGNIVQGTDLTLDAYIRNIVTGEERIWDDYLGDTTSGTGGTSETSWIVNAYNQNCANPSRLVSHAMQAEWDTDAGQFIGAACEVEGVCGPSTPECGNNIIETEIGEVCDGTNFGGQTCSDYGFTGGTLLCTTNCTVISTANCNNLSDTTPPTLSITSPSDGATVSGTIIIQASATDASGIQSVTFQVDGSTFATDTTSPYQVSGDTTLVSDGTHTITVIARDSSPNQNEATETITITVNNLGPPDPVCGNGVIESGEGCDDGDASSGDGCSSSCQIESGWTCSGEPSDCNPITSGGMEYRCAELGDNCRCNEPLRGDYTIHDTNYVEATNPTSLKPCKYTSTYPYPLISDEARIETQTSTDLPPQSTVESVWESYTNYDGAMSFLSDENFRELISSQDPVRRLCSRWYMKLDPGFDIETCNNKMWDFKAGTTEFIFADEDIGDIVHLNAYGTTECPSVCSSMYGYPFTETTSSGWDGLTICQEEWCRFEFCFGSDDLRSNFNNLFVEGYVKGIETGAMYEVGAQDLGDGNFGALQWAKTPGLWRATGMPNGPCNDDEGDPDGYGRKYSHIMLAAWDVDAGQFIGAACEIEGGCTSSYHRADTNKNGCIDFDEIGAFIDRWYIDSADVGMVELVRALEIWKEGC